MRFALTSEQQALLTDADRAEIASVRRDYAGLIAERAALDQRERVVRKRWRRITGRLRQRRRRAALAGEG